MKTYKVNMPACWAAAIINLDYSGLNKADRAELNLFLAVNDLSFTDCLGCGNNFIGRFNGYICSMAEYTYPARKP